MNRSQILAAVLMLAASAAAAQVVSIDSLERAGEFTKAQTLLREALQRDTGASTADRDAATYEIERLDRIRLDYNLTEDDLFAQLQRGIRDVTKEEMTRWIGEGRFDMRPIDGAVRFLSVSRSNLFWRYPDIAARRMKPSDDSGFERAILQSCIAIREAAQKEKKPYVLPKRFQVTMTVSADANAAPEGALVRAWIPIPRLYPFQHDFALTGSAPAVKTLAPEESPIRSAYLEDTAHNDRATKFTIEYAYVADGVSFSTDPKAVEAYDAADPMVQKYTAEAPHVVFTDEMRELSARIAGTETNPLLKARLFYNWIAENIQYSYAREYSTIRNLGDYCRTKKYGDCGQEAFLFMTLCRLNGIPARWQSGWFTFPGGKTIHDWSEIFIRPWGWMPVDPYMGIFAMQYMKSLSPEEKKQVRDFYFGGLDQFRVAANGDHCQTLEPAKKSYRSDTVDFQRGELEAGGKNIYFNASDYSLTIREF